MSLVVAMHAWMVVTLSSLVASRPLGAPASIGARDRAGRPRRDGDAGQTTAEYALVLIGAAALALLLISWATRTDRVGKLFDFVLEHITGSVR